MRISSKGRYAVRVMVDIATANKEYVSLSEIAERQKISVKYLERIVAGLTKAKLLESLMGSLGGYRLTNAPVWRNKCNDGRNFLKISSIVPELN